MRILLKDTLAMVVDIQEKLMPAIYENLELLTRVEVLVKGLNVLGVPIIETRQYPKGLGDTVGSIKELLKDAPVLDKVAFGSCDERHIVEMLESYGKKNIILCGAEAHVCVLQTLIGLRELGYNVVLVEDCIGSRKPSDKSAAVQRAIYEGAVITTSEAVLFELTRVAGTDTFREVSRIIKEH